MKVPLHPQEILHNFLHLNLTENQCIDDQSDNKFSIAARKEALKKQIGALLKQKSEYLSLLEQKQKLKTNLQELLNYRQSIDFDHKYKRIKFDHYQFPYRDNTSIKQDLYRQRLTNLDKRKKIRELEEEIKIQEKGIQTRKRQKENLNIWKIGRASEDDHNRDCDEDFWLKRIEKMKSRYLNGEQEWRRTKIKHDYNLLAEKINCCCTLLQTCPLCSDLNQLPKEPRRQSQGYAREALLSPRYTSIYGRSRIF